MNLKSLISLWNHTQRHPGTSGARACAGVLLGLYNGTRFPFDLTELRILDGVLLAAALEVIAADARRCQHEVHDWLNRATGLTTFGMRFEWLASDYKAFKRGSMTLKALREDYGDHPRSLIIGVDDSGITGKSATTMIVDELHDNPSIGEPVPLKIANVVFNPAPIKLNAQQAAAVEAMCENLPARTNQSFDMDAHQRAMNTPHFNDLAG